jgi:hypothetical protein
MGLLDNTTQQAYYQSGDLGNYQFTSLDHIITQFQIAYVGEGKIIQKVKRADIAFHAQRGLQEFSFDTFKCVKSQQIDLPPTLVMPLPHDYVNYTKLSCVDSAGIKHPLYPTNSTSNPFQILQNEDKSYDFTVPSTTLLKNGDFANAQSVQASGDSDWTKTSAFAGSGTDKVHIVSGELVFEHGSNAPIPGTTNKTSRSYAVWQEIDVTNIDLLDLSALGTSAASATGKGVGTLRVGISTLTYPNFNPTVTNPNKTTGPSLNNTDEVFDLQTTSGARALVTFNDGLATSSTLTLTDVDVSGETEVYVLVTSFIEDFTDTTLSNSKNIVDDIVISCDAISNSLQEVVNSSTWDNYKSATPSENQDDYEDDTYWKMNGNRYGLDPQYAQANGSFYIEERLGKIHFSSNISGKTVILDYISDSLGTDEEMQVHKFAEEAMYKYIAYAILSTSSQPIHQQLAPRFKKERFAETRKAKLRLSNVKLEELTQILRGKSKQIKH